MVFIICCCLQGTHLQPAKSAADSVSSLARIYCRDRVNRGCRMSTTHPTPDMRGNKGKETEEERKLSRISCANNLVLKSFAPGCKAKAMWQCGEELLCVSLAWSIPGREKLPGSHDVQRVSQTLHHCWEQDSLRMAILKEKTKTTNKTKKSKTTECSPLMLHYES